MQVFYTPRYYADIGDSHVFPIRKFEFVRDRLLTQGTLQPEELVEPSPAALAHHLPAVFAHNPEIIFYLAGADPYAGDKLGRLAVSIDGLRIRDAFVLRECYERDIPVGTVM